MGFGGAKPATTPVEVNQKLITHEYDVAVGSIGDEIFTDVTAHQRLIGKLSYM